MSLGASKNYEFREKREWREWHWNFARALLRRSGVNPKMAIVMGLFGADGLDVPEADRRGFRRENLFNIEREKSAIGRSRELGINTINCDLAEVLSMWPSQMPIDYLIADLCHGFTGGAQRLLDAVCKTRALRASSVICINMLRGRDSDYTSVRDAAIRVETGWSKLREMCPELQSPSRAIHALAVFRTRNIALALERGRRWLGAYSATSYRSGSTFFDSVVFRVDGIPRMDVVGELLDEQYKQCGMPTHDDLMDAIRKNSNELGVRRKIAAALAVRTMRLSAH